MMKKIYKILAVVLSLPLTLMSVTSCGKNDFGAEKATEEKTQERVEQLTENPDFKQIGIDFEFPVANLPQDSQTVEGEESIPEQDAVDPGDNASDLRLEYDYEDYADSVEGVESFVYGLVVEYLRLEYDVFSSYVTLSDETKVYGIGYTNFEEAYTLKGDEKTYFGAGFLAFNGEHAISESELASCLKMTRLGDDDDRYGFLYTYSAEDYMAHVVVYNKYVQYGVNDKQIVYTEEEVKSKSHLAEICDQSLGNLYSYDENKMLLEKEFGFTAVNGVSAIEEMDYESLQAEIEAILAQQDNNFCQMEIETMVNIGKEALESYLLGLQEETFCGYPVSVLIDVAEDLDPMSMIRITSEGLVAIEIEPQPPAPPSAFVKWMVGIAAGICVAMTVVCTVVPGLQGFVPLAGALSGIAIEAAVEVIGENKHLHELNPLKLAIAGIAGAVGGCVSNLVADAVIGGATNAVFTLLDGGSLIQAGTSFALGTACGLAIGGAFKLAAKGVSKAFKAIKVKKIPVVVDAIDDNVVNKLDDSALDAVKYNTGKAVKEAAEDAVVAGKSYSKNTIFTAESKAHILQGDLGVDKHGRQIWKGVHSYNALQDSSFEIIEKRVLSNGCLDIKYSKILSDGTRTIPKASTVFPMDWSDEQIIHAIYEVASGTPVKYDPNVAGKFLYKQVIDGVEIQVIKIGDNIITGCPVGNAEFSGFINIGG